VQLTTIAVVALPAGETDTLAARAAAVVAKIVVSRPAEILATLAVIVRRTCHPVLILHLGMRALVLVQGPLRSNVQPFLRSQSRDQDFL
jgi:hypothetical protein